MHSSGMHTAHFVARVSQHALLPEGICPREGIPAQRGVPARGGIPAWGCTCPAGVYLPGGGVYLPGGCTCLGEGCTCLGVYLPRYSPPCEQNS